MLKLALFDPRKRRRRPDAHEARPGVHDDFKATVPAVLSLDLPRLAALPRLPRAQADNDDAKAPAFVPRGAGAA